MAKQSRKQPKLEYVYLSYPALSKAMHDKGISQKILAQATGMKETVINRTISMTCDFRSVRKFIGIRIAKALDVPLSQLLRPDQHPPADC